MLRSCDRGSFWPVARKWLIAGKSTRPLCCEQRRGPHTEKVAMTLEQIKREIRNLNPSDRIELCRWLDFDTATDYSSGIGADRSREIRRTLNQIFKTNALPASRESDQVAGGSLHAEKDYRFPGRAA
jgi:hypothetical protein